MNASPAPSAQTPIVVAALYKFAPLNNVDALQRDLRMICDMHDIHGTLLLAHEGINGTVSGTRHAIDALKAFFNGVTAFDGMEYKESFAEEHPFHRMKVRIKKEIVTIGIDTVSPINAVGDYVAPEDWNALISRDDVLVIDTRNDYEVAIGTFKNAIDPKTKSFREFPAFVQDHFDPSRHKNIAMFCTGGIRCEKASSYMKQAGFENVYHLQGGILKYLETIPADQSMWDGECFVFDQRVAVKHGLEIGSYDLCHACRHPLAAEDKQADSFIEGVQCPHCVGKYDDTRRASFAEREKQMKLSAARGEKHIGRDFDAFDDVMESDA